jgi:hypothetical protein
MGSTIPVAELPRETPLAVSVEGTEPIERIDVVRSGQVVQSIRVSGGRTAKWAGNLEGLRAGEYVYIRAIQGGGGVAWSSPFFVGSRR